MISSEKLSEGSIEEAPDVFLRRRHIGFVIIVLIGVGLSTLSFLMTHNAMNREARAEFERAFQDRVTIISLTLEQKVNILRNIASFYAASDKVKRLDFQTFVGTQLDAYAGIQALEWIPRVHHAERALFEGLTSKEVPGFQITERETKGDMVRAGNRDEYFPVLYVEPLEGNEAAVGFDLASNAVRRKALELSRDTGAPLASGRITLVQEQELQYGFLIFFPVYEKGAGLENISERRRTLRGFTLGVYRIGDAINAALERLEARGVSIRIIDITDATSPTELYTRVSGLLGSPEFEDTETTSGNFDSAATVQVAGRTWRITGHSSSQFFSRSNSHWQARAIFLGGSTVSVLLGFIFLVLMRNAEDVRRLVEIRTQELDESRGRLKAILDNVVDGIITIDQQGIIQSVNPATNKIFGYQTGELEGQNVKILTASSVQENHDAYLDDYRKTGEAKTIDTRREVKGQRKDGTEFPVELVTTELSIGSERLFLGITRDITELKEIERIKDEFVSTVSHELRSPLTAMLGFLPFLKNAEKMPEPAAVAQMAGRMEVSGKHLLQVVNDLLDYSKIEAKKIKLNCVAVDIAEIVEEVVAELHLEIESKGLQIDVNVSPLLVDGDRFRLRQVLINLLGNAVKFTETGRVGVHLAVDRKKGEVAVSVTDSGPGIPPDLQASIFERFSQVEGSSTRIVRGTGLGLAITKNLVELHGGQIQLDSTEHKGSTFTFTVPLAENENTEIGHPNNISARAKT